MESIELIAKGIEDESKAQEVADVGYIDKIEDGFNKINEIMAELLTTVAELKISEQSEVSEPETETEIEPEEKGENE